MVLTRRKSDDALFHSQGGVGVRIAQVAPLLEQVPPTKYGGTERVIHSLTEELVHRGHDVTLFASGDSTTSARLEPIVERAIWHHPNLRDHLPFVIAELQTVLDRADEFDIIHSHLDYLGFPFARGSSTPWVHTLHGRMDLPEYQQLYRSFGDASVVSISNNQRRPVPFANWVATVYNGVPVDEYPFEPSAGDYLAFVGRIAPEKNLHVAIEVALRTEIPLKIAARMPLPQSLSPNDGDDWAYYEEHVKPRLDNPLIEYVGEVDEHQKQVLLRNAAALINPVNWPEPFGLVMAEALACGTPVIAKRAGSVPEIVEDGRTGFICDSALEMILACDRLSEIDRSECRQSAERRLSSSEMTRGYLNVYERAIERHVSQRALTILRDAGLDNEPVAPSDTDSAPSLSRN
jgi:glycosyltransferase involved in cell wall biosynthesis